jgi:hypothetical protein
MIFIELAMTREAKIIARSSLKLIKIYRSVPFKATAIPNTEELDPC